jgi:putative ABC transport system substrate-binding protein
LRRIAVLSGQQNDPGTAARLAAFREGLQKLGWIAGRNLLIEHRWAVRDPSRLNAYADELVRLAPEVIMVSGTPALAAIHRATKSIPVVFAQSSDPVGAGFVQSVAHPGGNITGFTDFEYTFGVKWLELLKEITPTLKQAAVVYDWENPLSAKFLLAIEGAQGAVGVKVLRSALRRADDVDRIGDTMKDAGAGGLIVFPGTLTLRSRERISMHAVRHSWPAIYPYRRFAESGGLVSYGVDVFDMYRGAALYVDRILKGKRPADLPIQFATKFELIVNLKTAKAMALELPTSILLRADEVIE